MPELPDITVYVEALERRVAGARLRRIRLASPFLLRSVSPRVDEVADRSVASVHRLGKRIVVELDDAIFLVIHLMIAGRLQWAVAGAAVPKKRGLAAFDFDTGTLILTEAGSRKRASLHLVSGKDGLKQHDPGGIEPLDADAATFAKVLSVRNHTIKRALTDPRITSGIGNAYSDEILHRARMSPFKRTSTMKDEEWNALHAAVTQVLESWTSTLRDEVGDGFPKKVTAFRPDFAVHGRYGEPCPDCGTKVQRIKYVENESNYCPRCQTGGKLLADRGMSRLLRGDWPKTIEELEGCNKS